MTTVNKSLVNMSLDSKDNKKTALVELKLKLKVSKFFNSPVEPPLSLPPSPPCFDDYALIRRRLISGATRKSIMILAVVKNQSDSSGICALPPIATHKQKFPT